MTEAEWLACAHPRSMLYIVQNARPSERKARLFNTAICRRFWCYLPAASQDILLQSECLADAEVVADSYALCRLANAAVAPFDRQYPDKAFPSREVGISRNAAAAVCYAVLPYELFGAASYFWDLDQAEKEPHAVIIRCIFGNLFRSSPSLLPAVLAWNDGTVRRLAEAIYEDRRMPEGRLDTGRLAILADALIDAGCDDEELLAHLRSEGPHVRGCWAVDLILGKT